MKKSCTRNRLKVFGYVYELIDEMNIQVLNNQGFKIENRNEYAIEYLEEVLDKYIELT